MKEEKRKKSFFYSLMIVFLLLFFSIFGEIVSRLFFKGILSDQKNGNVQDILSENPYILKFRPYVHSHIPNSDYIQKGKHFSVNYKINSLGLRSNEISLKKSLDKKRLVIIGDSATEGHGIKFEDTYVFLLQKLFENENWEVINAGIQGAGIAHQATNLPRYFQLNPDAILIATYENDLADDRRVEIHYNDFPILENPSIFFPDSISAFLFKSKFLQMSYVFFYKYLKPRTEIENIIKKNSKLIKNIQTPEQMAFKSLSFLHPSIVEPAWNMTSKYYDYFYKEMNVRNIPLFVVNITYQPYEVGFDPTFTKSADMLDANLNKYLEPKKIPYLSLKDFILEYHKINSESFAIPEDGHPNKEGHRFFSSIIYPWLKENLPK